ncbi:MAG: hypothetical protein GQ559_01750 [Desulfobulbaceae bacterium]|nr:hypothetical protein [Desulfobulbaceae bacterium]
MRKAEWGWKKAKFIFTALVITTVYAGTAAPVLAEESIQDLKATIEALKQTVLQLEKKMISLEKCQVVMEKCQLQDSETLAKLSKQQEEDSLKLQSMSDSEEGDDSGLMYVLKDMEMQAYGYAKLDALWSDVTGAGDIDLWVPGIPVGAASDESASDFRMHAKQSRFGLKTSTPTAWGKLNTVLEMDFYGQGGNQNMSNSSTLRVRKAYGELGNLRAGQDWSTFLLFTAFPETVDFAGPTGAVFDRQPLVRWTQPFEGGSWQIALENPESTFSSLDEAAPGSGNGEYMPDIVARVNLDTGFGNYAVAGLVRQLIVDSGVYDDESWVAGVTLSGSFSTFGKDTLGFNLNYGNGLGRYMMLGYKDAYINPETNKIETFDQFSGYINYRHFWMENLRSTICYSYGGADNDTQYSGDFANDNLQSMHANLIWSPIPRVNFGVEYIWASREQEDGQDGDLNRFQTGFQYIF